MKCQFVDGTYLVSFQWNAGWNAAAVDRSENPPNSRWNAGTQTLERTLEVKRSVPLHFLRVERWNAERWILTPTEAASRARSKPPASWRRPRRCPMTDTPPRLRRLRPGASVRQLNLGARVPTIPPAQEAASAERAALYASPRWRAERRDFLAAHPACVTMGCGQRATVVDHGGGHQRPDWRPRFWDRSTWQPMCSTCHAAKSARELGAWRRTGGTVPR